MTDPRTRLRADCARCAGLCCVGPAFAASADFAIDKPAGTPCVHLRTDDRCGIHDRLPERGFPGCTVFDCFGAGQQVVQATSGGRGWRESPELAAGMFAVLPVMRQLHEVLWHLAEVATLPVPAALHDEARALADRTAAVADAPAPDLRAFDLAAHRARVEDLLGRASAHVRAPHTSTSTPGRSRRGADLVGRDLRRTRLVGADLRGALLIGADLRGADLTRTDLLGADLRAADVRGADLAGALFLTRPQLAAAVGDAATRVPAVLEHPGSWRRAGQTMGPGR
ncbi:pentapeptide repeat-containing protein [Modestobacter sp. NPDC049651]|uniref:pentapeptide repeat-containing protein n=1 Tax=unclassified Modestobacter TaxID=2643866 RepID=UPI0033FF9065